MPATINGTTGFGGNLTGNVTGNVSGTALAGIGPAFYAFASGNTSVPNNTSTKVNLAGERFDTASCFASSRFTPNVAGYYQLNAAVWLGSTGAAYLAAEIRKNGLLVDGLTGSQDNGSDTRSSVVGGLIYFNGTTDYAELFCYQSSGSTRTVSGGQNTTYFSGFLARAA
jgi:hypothetical protein